MLKHLKKSTALGAVVLLLGGVAGVEAHSSVPKPFKEASIAFESAGPGRADVEIPRTDKAATLLVGHDGTKYTHLDGNVIAVFRLKAKVKSRHRIYGWVVTTNDPENGSLLPNSMIGAQDPAIEPTRKLDRAVTFVMDADDAVSSGIWGAPPVSVQDIIEKCNAAFPNLAATDKIVDQIELTIHAGFAAGKKRKSVGPIPQAGGDATGNPSWNSGGTGRPAIAHTTLPVKIVCAGNPVPRAAEVPAPRAGNTLFSIDLKVSQRGKSCPKDVTVTAYANYRWPAKSHMRMTVDGGFPKIRIVDTTKVVFAGKTFHRAEAQFHYKLDPGQRTFKLTVDHAEKTHTETIEIKCPAFKVLSVWLKYDVAQTPVCPKKVVETATFYTTRPGWVNHEIKMEGGLVVSQGKLTSKRIGDKYAAIAVRHLTVGAIDKQFIADVVNDPANSGWVPLKIECPQHETEAMPGLPSLRPPGVAGTPPAHGARTVVNDSAPRSHAAIAARRAAEAKRERDAKQKPDAKRQHDAAAKARLARRAAEQRTEAARKAAQAAARIRARRLEQQRAAARHRFQARRAMGMRAGPMTVRRPMNTRMSVRGRSR